MIKMGETLMMIFSIVKEGLRKGAKSQQPSYCITSDSLGVFLKREKTGPILRIYDLVVLG